MLRGVLVVVALGGVGCARPAAVTCSDGTICPRDTVCDLVHELCVTEAQTTACDDLLDTDRCTAGPFAGICDQGVCIAGCGDGVQEAEECDDGNYASHDGCSSGCTLEDPTWVRWETAWVPRARHVTGYLPADPMAVPPRPKGVTVIVGGTTDAGPIDSQWDCTVDGCTLRDDLVRPSARLGASMVYDAQHKRLVLFGGTQSTVTATAVGLDDTWTYDGVAWTKLAPASSPPPRFAAVMGYVGGRVVLFGGRRPDGGPGTPGWLADTWELDGTVWRDVTPVAPADSPPGRFNAMAAVLPSGRFVVFGGAGDNGGVLGQLDDQWEYTTTLGWVEQDMTPLPPPRIDGMMAYDTRRGRIVLHGGSTAAIPYGDTWEYDGTTWTPVPTASVPPGRSAGTLTMAEDLVLLGGASMSGALADRWIYEGGNWLPAASPGTPRARGEGELIYDADLRETVSLGGIRGPLRVDEVYRFGAAGWSTIGRELPETRMRFTSAYDPSRHHIVIFGGITTTPFSTATRVGTPTTWGPVADPQPPARRNGVMTFAPNLDRVVLFGGLAATGPRADTWLFDTAWSPLEVSGPAPSDRAAMAFDHGRDRVVLLDQAGVTWGLSPIGWEEISRTGPRPRIGGVMVYSHALRTVLVYGGSSIADPTTGAPSELLDDLWRLTDAGWVEIEIVGDRPIVRQDPRMVEHAPLRALLLHAGTAAAGQLDDTWLFQYRSAVPDEQCDNGVDDDGDRVVDARDPDCS